MVRVHRRAMARNVAIRVSACLLLCGCTPQVTESLGVSVTVRVPAFADSRDAQVLADRECAKQGLRAYFQSIDRSKYHYICNPATR